MDIELEVFEWHGTKRYRCPDCEFDAPSDRSVVKHWLESHKPKDPPAGPTLFDADDKPIDRSIYAPGFELPNFHAGPAFSAGADEKFSGAGNWDDSSNRE